MNHADATHDEDAAEREQSVDSDGRRRFVALTTFSRLSAGRHITSRPSSPSAVLSYLRSAPLAPRCSLLHFPSHSSIDFCCDFLFYYFISRVGSRVFTVAVPRVWNTLPEHRTSAPSLTIFCQRMKTWFFRRSYPDLII